MEQKKIDRINELYKKSKAEGLTPEEAKEQKILRKEIYGTYPSELKKPAEQY